MSQNELERRTFFACEICNLVYAGFDEPDACHNCESEMFIQVVPKNNSR